MTSWQSGETPWGKSAGDISVTRPPKISMGASKEPSVVIIDSARLAVVKALLGRRGFGECSQWGYWARLTSVEGCFAAPGVRVSHSPHRPSARLLTNNRSLLFLSCLSGVPSFLGGSFEPPFYFCVTLALLRRRIQFFRGGQKSPRVFVCGTLLGESPTPVLEAHPGQAALH